MCFINTHFLKFSPLKNLLFLGLCCVVFSCKPDPEIARQTHSVFTQARDKYKITRITESALKDSVDAVTKIFVHELNNSLMPLLMDSVFVCGETNLKQPAPPYVIDYQFLCNGSVTLKAEQNALDLLQKSYQNQIQRDTVLMIDKSSFLYLSPVYSDSTYMGIWGVVVGRTPLIQSL